MRRDLAVVVGLGLGLGLGTSACFYTEVIHDRPTAAITKVSDGPVHYPGETVEFDASKATAFAGGLTLTWSTWRCLETPCVRIDEVVLRDPAARYAVPLTGATAAERHAPRQIQLVVTDSQGARDTATFELEVGNREPVVELQLQQGDRVVDTAVVGVPIAIEARTDMEPDGDPLTLTWALDKPRGSAAAVGLEPADDSGARQTLEPDVDGVWRVAVTAADGFGGSETFSALLVMTPDQAPCLAVTEPPAGAGRYLMSRSEPPRRLGAQVVADDLDPYPASAEPGPAAGVAGFAWSLAAPTTGGVRVPLGESGAGVIVDPAAYPPGAELALRLDVVDRVTRVACAADAPTCEDRPGCAQRVTWEIEIR